MQIKCHHLDIFKQFKKRKKRDYRNCTIHTVNMHTIHFWTWDEWKKKNVMSKIRILINTKINNETNFKHIYVDCLRHRIYMKPHKIVFYLFKADDWWYWNLFVCHMCFQFGWETNQKKNSHLFFWTAIGVLWAIWPF